MEKIMLVIIGGIIGFFASIAKDYLIEPLANSTIIN